MSIRDREFLIDVNFTNKVTSQDWTLKTTEEVYSIKSVSLASQPRYQPFFDKSGNETDILNKAKQLFFRLIRIDPKGFDLHFDKELIWKEFVRRLKFLPKHYLYGTLIEIPEVYKENNTSIFFQNDGRGSIPSPFSGNLDEEFVVKVSPVVQEILTTIINPKNPFSLIYFYGYIGDARTFLSIFHKNNMRPVVNCHHLYKNNPLFLHDYIRHPLWGLLHDYYHQWALAYYPSTYEYSFPACVQKVVIPFGDTFYKKFREDNYEKYFSILGKFPVNPKTFLNIWMKCPKERSLFKQGLIQYINEKFGEHVGYWNIDDVDEDSFWIKLENFLTRGTRKKYHDLKKFQGYEEKAFKNPFFKNKIFEDRSLLHSS